jgi:hypothetical protein
MIVDAELFWIVMATTGTKSFSVFNRIDEGSYLRNL